MPTQRANFVSTCAPACRRRAFTLVELLVVIAIIGILVALLLPAVQAAREAARRTQCVNQLKQLGLAITTHHDQFGAFPPGRTNTRQTGQSWAFRLLPFVEEVAVHDALVPGERVDAEVNATAMRTPIELFACPSRRSATADRDFDNDDQPSQTPAAGASGDYAANAGRELLTGLAQSPNDSRPFDRNLDLAEVGPMFTYSRIKARRVTDGLSKTLAAGERHIPGTNEQTPENQAHYWQGDTAFFAGDNPVTVLAVPGHGLRQDGEPAEPDDGEAPRESFGGPHPGVTLFTYLDGHVEPVQNDTNEATLELLASIGDGEVITTN